MTLPRRPITYPFETQGYLIDREIPFRVGVIADLAGDPVQPLAPLAERRFLPLGEGGIEAAMARLQPGLRLGPHSLVFRRLEDFSPEALAAQHPVGLAQHPRLIRLAAAWRGLALLLNEAGDDAAVQICALPASQEELAGEAAQPWLRQRIEHEAFQPPGPTPFALLVGDQAWTASEQHIAALTRLAATTAAVFTPYVAQADPSLSGLAEGAEPPAWQALRAFDAARSLVLTTGAVPDAPFLLAAALVAAFRRDGFCAELPGAAAAQNVAEADLVQRGFLPVTNTSPPGFAGGMTLHQPRTYDRPEATRNAAIAASLPYAMVTGRIAQVMKAMQRDRIGPLPEPRTVEAWLSRWLAGLAQAGVPGATPPPHPLYSASLEVRAVPGDPTAFDAICRLRPWLAHAELTSELRMIVRLDRHDPPDFA